MQYALRVGDTAYVEYTLGDSTISNNIVNGFRLVVSIRVQCLIGDNMVLQKGL